MRERERERGSEGERETGRQGERERGKGRGRETLSPKITRKEYK